MKRRGYTVGGQVQGVGFRPFVFRTAERFDLSGFVGNTSDGVRIEVQGEDAALEAFDRALIEELPVLARIVSCVREELKTVASSATGAGKDRGSEGESFRIVASQGHQGHAVLVSPDVAACSHCLADMNDPANRRYQYPFTNCTDCGPRYTITRSIPYDRPATSMSCFPLCPDCQAEYDNPRNRRFHAQPNACPVCGPQVWLTDGKEEDLSRFEGSGESGQRAGQAAIEQTAAALAAGKIVAVKGLGGFHLVCDATSDAAIATLRHRKHRPHKSLAIMVPDMETARRVACIPYRTEVSSEKISRKESVSMEEARLTSSERPIVVLPARAGVLPRGLAPDLDSVGVMLPYTPLHHLLLKAFRVFRPHLPALVMTSGNAGGEPIALGNREALVRLRDIADLFLLHNRDILIRADDSVVCILPSRALVSRVLEDPEDADRLHVFRRARGYVPRPLPLPEPSENGVDKGNTFCILATGAELKTTLCLTRGNNAFMSQHIGDLKNIETYSFFRDMVAHLGALLEVRPEALVCDLHPDYLSTAFALEFAAGKNMTRGSAVVGSVTKSLPVLRIQHHFAHIYSVLGEHGHLAPALGLALDGTGYGTDGTVWGGELLLVHPEAVRDTARSADSVVSCLLDGVPDTVSEQSAFEHTTPWGQRLGRLSPFSLPGGEAAIREPWRLASGFLGLLSAQDMETLHLTEPETVVASFFPDAKDVSLARMALVHVAIGEMVRRKTTPRTSSCGRLFDAVSALLGLCPIISYEGQAAIRLERAAAACRNGACCGGADAERDAALPFVKVAHHGDLWELDTAALFLHLLQSRYEGVPVPVLASRFHAGLVEGLADLALRGAQQTGVHTVALSGGVLHNRLLAQALPVALARRGLVPLMHRALPPGDGGIAFGQAFWARLRLERGSTQGARHSS